MTREEFNVFCGSMIATNHVVQWGNSDVWKVGPKLFAVGGWHENRDAFTFKVGPIAFDVLPEIPGIRPAPYLASRGMKWVQVYGEPGLSDADLRDHLTLSYNMVAAGISKKKRAEMGIVLPQ